MDTDMSSLPSADCPILGTFRATGWLVTDCLKLRCPIKSSMLGHLVGQATPAAAGSSSTAVVTGGDGARWLRPWVFAALCVLTAVTVVTPFVEDMPPEHRVFVPMAAAIIFAVWVL